MLERRFLNKPNRVAATLLFLLAAIYTAHVLSPAEGWALGTYDMRGLFYPWWEAARNAVFRGEIPWWDERQLAGNPFLHNPQIAFFYPLTWIALFFPLNIGISVYAFVHLWLAGVGMYLFTSDDLRVTNDKSRSSFVTRKSLLNLPAFLAAITFMFSGFFVARLFAGHSGLFAVHIWLPWLLWATQRTVRRQSTTWAAITSLFFALIFLAGHVTSVVYMAAIWGLFVLWIIFMDDGMRDVDPDHPAHKADDRHRPSVTPSFRHSVILLASVPILTLLLSAVQLIPTAQLIQLAGRTGQGSFEFATDFSFPITHLITIFVP
ncbi:MAG: hypothetical protein AAF633_23125, partial [Chloroflexota bacterium]